MITHDANGYDGSRPALLRYCHHGLLKSCNSDSHCWLTGGEEGYYEVPAMDGEPPHWLGQDKSTDHHFFCTGHECAISQTSTCCASEYRGQRPFETVEARMLRELVNNVPFAVVLDLHSSAAYVMHACTQWDATASTPAADGCVPGDTAHDNGSAMIDAMVEAYNVSAGAHWGAFYSGGIGLPFPVVDLPKFLSQQRKKDSAVYERGQGKIGPWLSSMPVGQKVTVNGFLEDVLPTLENFDLGTLRAIPTFGVELGIPKIPKSEWDGYDEDDKLLARRCVSCDGDTDSYPGGGSAPRSRLMVENQLVGTIALVDYVAKQAANPWAAAGANGAPIDVNRRDLALTRLTIHDGYGRGLQQTELRWQKIGDDPTAVIVIPAGAWAVETEVAAAFGIGNQFILPIDAELDLWVSEDSTLENIFLAQALQKHLPVSEKNFRVKRRHRFRAGEKYYVHAEVTPASGNITDNDTAANDTKIARVAVRACTDSDLPNGVNGHDFCRKGLPFDDDRFWCGASGTCRECGVGPQKSLSWCDGPQGFCVDGQCDTSAECWSGSVEDANEGSSGTETPVVFKGFGTHAMLRSLHLDGSSPTQDEDVLEIHAGNSGTPMVGTGMKLAVRVKNLCAGVIDDPLWSVTTALEEVEVRVDQRRPTPIPGLYTWDPILAWTQPDQTNQLTVSLGVGATTKFLSGRPLRVGIRNTADPARPATPYSFTYRLEATLTTQHMAFPSWPPEVIDASLELAPTGEVDVNLELDATELVTPVPFAVETGQRVFLRSDDPTVDLSRTSRFLLVDRDGQIATTDAGVVVGNSYPLDGGLALDLAGLSLEDGPYRAVVQSAEGRLEGRIYLCPAGARHCGEHDPRRDSCEGEGACDGEWETCCLAADGSFSCEDLKSDEFNCGGCGVTCEWDEVCLEGVCARGQGRSCWETECPAGTWCVSDVWLLRTNPKCKALDVDNANCGWYRHQCAANTICTAGLCLPKMSLPCDGSCGESEQCCWALGQQTCVSRDNPLHCGACGNACPLGALCEAGLCQAWYDVWDPCPWSTTNCGQGGEIACRNLSNDLENCGRCRGRCPPDAWCQDGVCTSLTQDYGPEEDSDL